MDLNDYRKQIDEIDAQLCALFEKRMDVAAGIAEYKRENGLPVLDGGRERKKLKEVMGQVRPEFKGYTAELYSMIFELSKCYQHKLADQPLDFRIGDALENTPKIFPTDAVVACQGVEGAYSQIACEKLFRAPDIMYFNNFESVFCAIEDGLCDYGVLPLENSTAGSVKSVYDLMMKHNFSIVRSTRVKVDHCLLTNHGAELSEIKEIYSHEQAISQCSQFLGALKGVRVIPCENTAIAAQKVRDSGRNDVAAISSRFCAGLYNLKCLQRAIQNQGNNYTKFICISKKTEIYPGADKTSLMMILPHKPGSLYKILSHFYALGINLIKIESRPIPDRDFEFMFYFDLETSVYSEEFTELMSTVKDVCEEFVYLGSYSEVI